MKVIVDGQSYEIDRGRDSITVDNAIFSTRIEAQGRTRTVYVNDFPYRVELPENFAQAATLTILVDGRPHEVQAEGKMRASAPAPPRPVAAPKRGPAPQGAVVAAMAGRIVSVTVKAGQAVKAGQVLLVLEAMKMENELTAPKDGVVKEIVVTPGARVNEGDVLVVIE